jgi:hypothetical protein
MLIIRRAGSAEKTLTWIRDSRFLYVSVVTLLSTPLSAPRVSDGESSSCHTASPALLVRGPTR